MDYFPPSRFLRCLSHLILAIAILGATFKIVYAQQSQYQWINQELLDKKIERERYLAIGRGDIAQCSADARVTVQRTISYPDCNALMSSTSAFLAQECLERLDNLKKTSEVMYQELAVGCMAKRAWLWTKVN